MDEDLDFVVAIDIVCDIARESLCGVGSRHARGGIGETREIFKLVGEIVPDFRSDSGGGTARPESSEIYCECRRRRICGRIEFIEVGSVYGGSTGCERSHSVISGESEVEIITTVHIDVGGSILFDGETGSGVVDTVVCRDFGSGGIEREMRIVSCSYGYSSNRIPNNPISCGIGSFNHHIAGTGSEISIDGLTRSISGI